MKMTESKQYRSTNKKSLISVRFNEIVWNTLENTIRRSLKLTLFYLIHLLKTRKLAFILSHAKFAATIERLSMTLTADGKRQRYF